MKPSEQDIKDAIIGEKDGKVILDFDKLNSRMNKTMFTRKQFDEIIDMDQVVRDLAEYEQKSVDEIIDKYFTAHPGDVDSIKRFGGDI